MPALSSKATQAVSTSAWPGGLSHDARNTYSAHRTGLPNTYWVLGPRTYTADVPSAMSRCRPIHQLWYVQRRSLHETSGATGKIRVLVKASLFLFGTIQ